MEIKIVDWDVASLLGEPLDYEIAKNMRELNASANNYYWHGLVHGSEPNVRHDAWFVFILSYMNQGQRDRCEAAANQADTGAIVGLYTFLANDLTASRPISDLHTEFEETFMQAWCQ